MKNIKFQRRHSRNCFVWGPVVETDAVCVLVVIYGQRGRKRCSHRNGAAHETNDTQQFQLCRPLTERRWTGKKFDIYTPAFDLWHHFAQRVGSLVFYWFIFTRKLNVFMSFEWKYSKWHQRAIGFRFYRDKSGRFLESNEWTRNVTRPPIALILKQHLTWLR